jgi:hypothetical protein
MAGYSGTPLYRKLGVKAGGRLLLVGAPDDFGTVELAELPDDVVLHRKATGAAYDVVILFVRAEAELRSKFTALTKRITPAGRLWVAWPRKAGGFVSDVTENAIRDLALASGLVDNKVAALSEAWSGLQIVYRLKDRS